MRAESINRITKKASILLGITLIVSIILPACGQEKTKAVFFPSPFGTVAQILNQIGVDLWRCTDEPGGEIDVQFFEDNTGVSTIFMLAFFNWAQIGFSNIFVTNFDSFGTIRFLNITLGNTEDEMEMDLVLTGNTFPVTCQRILI